jgi:hypothetical protein
MGPTLDDMLAVVRFSEGHCGKCSAVVVKEDEGNWVAAATYPEKYGEQIPDRHVHNLREWVEELTCPG